MPRLSPKEDKNKDSIHWIWFVLVVIIGAWLRLSFFSSMEWKEDEQNAYVMAGNFLKHPTFLPYGLKTSMGDIYELPLFIYTTTLFRWLGRTPLGTVVWVVLLNIIGLAAAAYGLFRSRWRWIALVALAFFAVSPWAITFSRKLWSPDLILPFLIPALALFVRVLQKSRSRAIFPLLCLIALASEMYLPTVALAVALAWTAWRRKVQFHQPSLMAGIGVSVALFFPWAVFTMVSHFTGEARLQLISPFKFISIFVSNAHMVPLKHPFSFATGWEATYALADDEFMKFMRWPCGWLTGFIHLATAILAWPFMEGLVEVIKLGHTRDAEPEYATAFAALIFFPLFMLMSPIDVYPHHMIPAMPYVFVAIALGFFAIYRRVTPWFGDKAARCLVGAWIIVSLVATAAIYPLMMTFINAQGGSSGDYGVPYVLQK